MTAEEQAEVTEDTEGGEAELGEVKLPWFVKLAKSPVTATVWTGCDSLRSIRVCVRWF